LRSCDARVDTNPAAIQTDRKLRRQPLERRDMRNPMEAAARSRQPNLRGEGARLRTELFDAAMRILDRAPATQLSLRMVAREAGVAAPSIYAHYPNAQTMMLAIVRECWRQLADEMALVVPPGRTDDPFGELQSQMNAYVRFAMERPSRYQLLFGAQPMASENYPESPGLLQPAFRHVLSCVERISSQHPGVPRDARADTLLTLAIAHGRIAIAHLAPERPGNGQDAVAAFVANALRRVFED
jgi:AcrR family transcriptional regulator